LPPCHEQRRARRPTNTRAAQVITPTAASSFSYASAHRDLHSFPTRRSSDLYRGLTKWMTGDQVQGLSGQTPHLPAWDRWTKALRSEEHTSELQSRGHLVCRLLLEKKNTTWYAARRRRVRRRLGVDGSVSGAE